MRSYKKAKLEIDKARDALQNMRSAPSHSEFELAWKDLLSHLERSWNKIQDCYKRNSKWKPWFGHYSQRIKKDPLLMYLKNARGADEHTVGEITSGHPGNISIGSTGRARIFGFGISQNGIYIDGSLEDPGSKFQITFEPERTRLLPINNRGVVIDIPKEHLGMPIDPHNVVKIAELGIKYYEELINAAIQEFNGKSS